jgi:1-deoxy-D-xylulose 5-phosphate reductoisomerase
MGGATLLPIDSEHSAVFQSLPSLTPGIGLEALTKSSSLRRAAHFAVGIRLTLRT